ncbi:hypothetical protein AS034_00620 [[Bacillus] enclensis]|uniref:Uncharacterized protein n=1 Tax=[Bacillus] enclensis TaxID=1402860 RepID=A0A0V8HP98_9BACI|nr:hypothetical protein [[Bacillus] enclensis]KSU64380.1 hypothetical protein AS034_00620 [[Bacillus] enclensis]SCB73189.1 hypothetical protein GA0061094_0129 [[Bacillus] enclensis]
MGKDIRSIRGNQTPNPNPIGPECIRVQKVYDWVVISDRYSNKVDLPDDCIAAIEGCSGQVTATCEEVPGSRDCDEVASRPANVPGVEGARIVTLVLSTELRIRFFCSGSSICEFTVPVSFTDEVILCNPPGTEINCDIFDVDCAVVLSRLLDNRVLIDVVICADVQVEAEVKLEVEAKFCGPRQAIPIENLRPQCDRFPLFPRQCPTFFPPANCQCQGSASLLNELRTVSVRSGGGLTSVDGRLTLNTVICDQCTLSGSSLTAVFQDLPGGADPAVDQSFTFFATQFNQPACITTSPGAPPTNLTVTGVGTFKLAGQQETNAQFQMTINDATNTVDLTIREEGGTEILATMTVAIPAENIFVGDCDQF